MTTRYNIKFKKQNNSMYLSFSPVFPGFSLTTKHLVEENKRNNTWYESITE